MGAIVECPTCKEKYPLNTVLHRLEENYIQEDGRCWKCHVTEHMLKAFQNGIEVNGVKMYGKKK